MSAETQSVLFLSQLCCPWYVSLQKLLLLSSPPLLSSLLLSFSSLLLSSPPFSRVMVKVGNSVNYLIVKTSPLPPHTHTHLSRALCDLTGRLVTHISRCTKMEHLLQINRITAKMSQDTDGHRVICGICRENVWKKHKVHQRYVLGDIYS